MVTVFFYPHIFTGSVGKRILIVVPVDTLHRTSIISSSTVLPLNPFVNLSLAPLSLFSIYGPDLGVWPDYWVFVDFLRAPIPRKESGSTITTFYLGFFAPSCRAKLCLQMSAEFLMYLLVLGNKRLLLLHLSAWITATGKLLCTRVTSVKCLLQGHKHT